MSRKAKNRDRVRAQQARKRAEREAILATCSRTAKKSGHYNDVFSKPKSKLNASYFRRKAGIVTSVK